MSRSPNHSWSTLILPAFLLLGLVSWSPGCSSNADADADGTAEAATSDEEGSASADATGKEEGEEVGEEGTNEKDEDEEKKETPVPVEVVALDRGSIQAALRATSNLEAENQVKVYSQAARLLTELRVEEGDRVKQGDLLVRLQDDEQRSALAKVQSQHDKAAREYERQKTLHEKNLISDELFNTATYEVEQLKIALDDARRELGYTKVGAPISGTITGRYVQVGDQITLGQHLFDLVDFDSIVARIYIPEKELPRLRVGQTAWVSTQGTADRPYRGRVGRISPIVDSQTGTVKVTVMFDRGGGIRPGMYVDVNLITEVHANALLVPKRALIYDDDQIYVYRLREERRVERLLVDLVLEDRDHVEPAGGLEPGDEIVIAGQAGLKDNALVRLPGDPDPDEEDEEDTKVASKEAE